jgi:hypothetical protein
MQYVTKRVEGLQNHMNKVVISLTVDGVVLVVGVIDLGLGLMLYREEATTRKVEVTFRHGIDARQ